jgi:hypothetical protein
MRWTLAFALAMATNPYRASPGGRITAFFFTDRVGQTIAATLGFFSIARWWLGRRLRRQAPH